MLSEIHSLSSKLEELNKYKQERQLVICSKKAAETVNTYTNRVNGLSEQNNVKEYKFEPNEKIRKFLHSLDSLGVAKEIQDSGETNSQSTYPDVPSQTSHQLTASYVGNIDVRHFTDKKSCFITGGVLIDETRLAFLDRTNFSVKIADVDNNTLLICTKLPAQPRDVTCVNRDQIVVTCSDSSKGKLVFLNVDKSLTVLKEFDISKKCRGIVYSNEKLFVCFVCPESSVKLMDMNGKVLKIFKTHKDEDALFIDPVYISLSTDQQTVFVSDSFNNTVMRLTLDGTVHYVYTADSLKTPRGLAVDRNDNIYITGYWSDNIHQLSTDGNQNQVILDKSNGVVGPWMMTYCKTRHRLYISVQKDGRHGLSVYQPHS